MTEPRYDELLRRLIAENDALRAALWDQWTRAHSENCDATWPHLDGTLCQWPILPVMLGQSARPVLPEPARKDD